MANHSLWNEAGQWLGTDEQLIEAMAAEARALAPTFQVDVTLDYWTLAAVHALLQLALRHPQVNDRGGHTARTAEGFARRLERVWENFPAHKEAARRGWLPKHDR